MSKEIPIYTKITIPRLIEYLKEDDVLEEALEDSKGALYVYCSDKEQGKLKTLDFHPLYVDIDTDTGKIFGFELLS